MNPKQLKPVFTWETRRVLFQDSVWYFPDYFEDSDFVFPGWPALFGNSHPIQIEYCSGNGSWIIEKAKANPHLNWVAVEKKYERVRKIWSKLKNHALSNLIVLCGEGFSWTQKYVPSASITEVFVNFPDPWPKERHAKHRIVKPAFAQEMVRILAPEGSILLVTDDADYSQIMQDTFSSHFTLSSFDPVPNYGTSYFDSLWREKGRLIRYHRFTKL